MKKIKMLFSPKEDKTDLNLLLRLLLNDKTTEESLNLKVELDQRYREIMEEQLKEKSMEVKLLSNYLKGKNETGN